MWTAWREVGRVQEQRRGADREVKAKMKGGENAAEAGHLQLVPPHLHHRRRHHLPLVPHPAVTHHEAEALPVAVILAIKREKQQRKGKKKRQAKSRS